jgi:D-alanyl-D-alanine carboxypeptidase
MRRWIALLIICISLVSVVSAQDNAPTDEQIAIADEAIAQLAEDVPGVVVYIETPTWTFERAVGLAVIQGRTPVEVDQVFRVGSITKIMTAVIILQLVEEGALTLDDPLSRWLPDVAAQLEYGEQVTVRQMLDHTSGIYDPISDPAVIDEVVLDRFEYQWTMDDVLPYIFNGAPYFEPGEPRRWTYSNSNYLLLGMVIEAASGDTYVSQLRTRILDPLGMGSTYLSDSEPARGTLAHGYVEGGILPLDVTHWNASVAWAAGAVASTVKDLARFGRALFGGELLQPGTLAQMLELNPNSQYGLGITQQIMPGLYGHDGSVPGYDASLVIAPDTDSAAVVLINTTITSPTERIEALQSVLLRLLP